MTFDNVTIFITKEGYEDYEIDDPIIGVQNFMLSHCENGCVDIFLSKFITPAFLGVLNELFYEGGKLDVYYSFNNLYKIIVKGYEIKSIRYIDDGTDCYVLSLIGGIPYTYDIKYLQIQQPTAAETENKMYSNIDIPTKKNRTD